MFTPDYPAYSMRATEFLTGCIDPSYRPFFEFRPPLWNPEFTLGRSAQAGGDALDDILFTFLHEHLLTDLTANGSATTTRFQSEHPRSGLVQLLQPIFSASAPHHGLFASFALGELDPAQLDPVTETWRRVLMYLAPNHDFVAQFRSPKPDNLTTLFATLLAIQTYSSHAEHFVLSLIRNSQGLSYIRMTNTRDTTHAGINFITTNTPQPDEHSRVHTLRDLQRQPVIFDRRGFQVKLPETDPRHITIRSHATSPSYGSWLNSTSRLIRAMVQHGLFPNQLEVDSLLTNRPAIRANFTLDQAAGTIANLGHALFTDSFLTTSILNAIELSTLATPTLAHHTQYRHDIQHALHSLLGTTYDHLPPEQLDTIISLLSTFAHLFPFGPDTLYATVPPRDQRDHVQSATIIPPSYHATEIFERTTRLLNRMPLDTNSALDILKKYR
ncbi:MAG: hypothetical protein V1487_02335 [bacterium]